ncbi:cytochrome b5 [Mollisia scopiformis]|uniref:Cytochrome b5 n=1 Tax=Mollisia scopiformis TaxID=149040 RepID=A0A194XMX0_MOLSC|nr:cytochrome b5 [Mollisia scopiformis]KUJ21610.1 cytochrome b5 [Mollisia scopiformis]
MTHLLFSLSNNWKSQAPNSPPAIDQFLVPDWIFTSPPPYRKANDKASAEVTTPPKLTTPHLSSSPSLHPNSNNNQMSSYQYAQAKAKNANMPDVRQRKAAGTSSNSSTGTTTEKVKAEDKPSILLDVARTIVFLLLASSAISYLVTRESFVWGVKRPGWSRPEAIRAWIQGPTQYTDSDLLSYDGTDASKPILLAINGTIYDVSAGRKHYGPGGSYHFFAGRDASRAFVTNCFQEDGHPDMRGVEEMFIPLDNAEVDALYSRGELKVLREQERRNARKEVDKALRHWVDFFAGSGKYPRVGYVKREKGWETKGLKPTLCKRAQEGRPTSRKRPEGK